MLKYVLKYVGAIVVPFILSFSSLGQQLIDPDAYGYYSSALNFSSSDPIGTSAALGYGGAQIALGGQISSTSVNPAGLGVYRSSEVVMSLGLNSMRSNTDYISASSTRSSTGFNQNLILPNLGFVFAEKNDAPASGPWKNHAFAINMNRTKSYASEQYFQGNTLGNSFRESIVELGQGIHFDDLNNQLDTNTMEHVNDIFGLAYWSYLMNNDSINWDDWNDPVNSTYSTLDPNVDNFQEGTVKNRGRKNQWDIAYGANYNDKILLGGAISIHSIHHENSLYFTERPTDNTNSELNSLTYEYYESTNGTGISASFGLIAKPSDFVRIGVSMNSPAVFAMSEETGGRINTKINHIGGFLENTEYDYSLTPGEFNYRLITPWKIGVGGAFFIGKYGFISADLDYLGYDAMQLRSNSVEDFRADNQTISNIFKPTTNLRIGGELRLDNLRFRVGGGYYGNPYVEELNAVDIGKTYFTGGFGIKTSDYFLDFALVHSRFESGFSPYVNANDQQPVALSNNTNTSFTITGGLKF